ncbi:MAG: hypothetical protein M1368_06870, partial [Thaumarchaeota archaeon]|nr:hypothetical protein [Nitrososphaerota archaeon]
YAPFLEFGTRPHTIEVKNARALHFQKGGQDVFAKSVQHPGIQAGKFSFIGPAIEEGIGKLVQDLLKMFEEKLS